MAAMASKFNFECVIQYYTDQWSIQETMASISEYLIQEIHFHLLSHSF